MPHALDQALGRRNVALKALSETGLEPGAEVQAAMQMPLGLVDPPETCGHPIP
ncbi:hypothetical protein [Gemmobacter serpentinus]|uniref:hypothetical protein n=1 Tax=Gemmobacter serpentinus TaxID=2652247 RepID=UPI00186586BC|nr:hypothetical protein [Gemmobacter serpentinus]